MTKPFELIIFDWDGTLIDSQQNIVQCLQSMINDLKLPERTSDQLSNIIGLGLYEALTQLFPDHPEDLHKQMIDRYRYHFLSSEPSTCFPGVDELLPSLVEDGYMLAVATGKGRAGLEKALDQTGFRQWFVSTRCADESRSKPHPQMLEEILDETGIERHKALMIGDTEYDMLMARHVSMASVGVSYGVHTTERLQQHDPLTILDDIRHLLNWLNGEKIAKTL